MNEIIEFPRAEHVKPRARCIDIHLDIAADWSAFPTTALIAVFSPLVVGVMIGAEKIITAGPLHKEKAKIWSQD